MYAFRGTQERADRIRSWLTDPNMATWMEGEAQAAAARLPNLFTYTNPVLEPHVPGWWTAAPGSRPHILNETPATVEDQDNRGPNNRPRKRRKRRSPAEIPTFAPRPHGTTHDVFMESLFDAMADDEGAAFWEGAYGQPIHKYGSQPNMNDEEYASYVRAEMYKKTQEARRATVFAQQEKEMERMEAHLRAQRHRREKRHAEREQDYLRREWDKVGRDGQQHKNRRDWEKAQARRQRQEAEDEKSSPSKNFSRCQSYHVFWDSIQELRRSKEPVSESMTLPKIRWPVFSGLPDEISHKNVKVFVDTFAAEFKGRREMLRSSRVFWHPDKFLQLYGEDRLSTTDLGHVTAVFQAIDSLWKEEFA